MKTSNDRFLAQLCDIYYGKQQSFKVFPGTIADVSVDELPDALESHSTETEYHEIAMSDSFCVWARHMAYEEIVQFLVQALEEEKLADCLNSLEATRTVAV